MKSLEYHGRLDGRDGRPLARYSGQRTRRSAAKTSPITALMVRQSRAGPGRPGERRFLLVGPASWSPRSLAVIVVRPDNDVVLRRATETPRNGNQHHNRRRAVETRRYWHQSSSLCRLLPHSRRLPAI